MKGIPFVNVDYCQYSDWGYQKPTRFWGSDHLLNLELKRCPKGPLCPNWDRGGDHHRVRLSSRHQNRSPRQKYRIPDALVWEMVRAEGPAPSQTPEREGAMVIDTPPAEMEMYQIRQVRGDQRQLLLRVRAQGPDGVQRTMSALVDTGAQVNLIRKGLFPEGIFRPAARAVRLVTADGKDMEGGRR